MTVSVVTDAAEPFVNPAEHMLAELARLDLILLERVEAPARTEPSRRGGPTLTTLHRRPERLPTGIGPNSTRSRITFGGASKPPSPQELACPCSRSPETSNSTPSRSEC